MRFLPPAPDRRLRQRPEARPTAENSAGKKEPCLFDISLHLAISFADMKPSTMTMLSASAAAARLIPDINELLTVKVTFADQEFYTATIHLPGYWQ